MLAITLFTKIIFIWVGLNIVAITAFLLAAKYVKFPTHYEPMEEPDENSYS